MIGCGETESENLIFVKACETVDGVSVLGVTPELIRPATAPPALLKHDSFE